MTNDDRSCLDRRVLTREGLRLRGTRFGSPALASLGLRLEPGSWVQVRIDPTDPTHIHALDEGRVTWVRADRLSSAPLDPG